MKAFRSAHRTWLVILLLVAVVAAIYVEAPQGERVFDDGPLLGFSCNDDLASFHLDSACKYRPVRHLSFAVEGSLWGIDNDVAHHVVNIVLHASAAIILFFLVRLLLGGGAVLAPALVALLFAVHPAQVDAVAYMSGRRDVLCGLFFLCAFYLLVKSLDLADRRHRVLGIGAATLLWLLALGSKEMAVTLPAIALWYEYVFHSGNSTKGESLVDRMRWLVAKRLKYFAPLLAVAGAFVLYRGVFDAKSHLIKQGAWWGGSLWTNLMTSVGLQRYFAEVILVPLRLPGDWNPPMIELFTSLGDVRFWLGLAVILALLGGIASALRRNYRLVAFGLGWYLISVLPVSQLIPHHEIFAEHYLYIPLMGLLIALGGLLHSLLKSNRKGLRTATLAVMGLLLILFGLRAHQHVADYQNSYTLAHATLRWAPDHPRAMIRAANWLDENDRPDESEGFLLAVLQTDSSTKLRQTAYEMLGLRYLSNGEHQKFAAIAQRAYEDYPGIATFQGLHGVLMLRQGQEKRGLATLTRAARERKSAADINFIAALEHRKRGDTDTAIELLRQGVTKKHATARMKLALAHLLLDTDPQESRRLIESVLKEQPSSTQARGLLDKVEAPSPQK